MLPCPYKSAYVHNHSLNHYIIAIRKYINDYKKSNPQTKERIPDAKQYVNKFRNEMDKRVHALIMGLLN